MRRMNAYSMDIYNYNIEHGTNIFMEYKNENTTEERRKEIEDWLFNLMREKDIIPITLLDENSEQEDMIRLSEVEAYDTYDKDNGDYGTNSVGVTFLNKFFAKELCDIRKPSAPKTIEEAFHDDKTLRKVIRKSLKYTENELGIFRWILLGGSCGYCVNFRPAVAKALLEIWGPEKEGKYLDTSAGYGARCLGANMTKNIDTYIGIDPNTAESCAEEIKFLDTYYPTGTKKQVLKMGSEDFTPENFPQYQNYFDISFTSPPYFNTEQYSSDETQSYKKFPTYAGWCEGFLQATIDNTCSALKADGIFAMNIFEKVPNIKKIIQLFLANNGWYVFQTDKYLLKTMPGGKKDENGNVVARKRDKYSNYEPIFMAKHYSRLFKEGTITEEQAKQFKERAIKDTHKIDI